MHRLDGPRGARAEELPAVAALADSIFRGAGGQMAAQYPTLFHSRNASWLRTFWDGPRPVALVGVWRGQVVSYGRVWSVAHFGAVCTEPSYRGRGLAWALLSDAMARLAAEHTALLFISGDRSLYRRLGARPYGHLWCGRVGSEALGALAAEGADCSWQLLWPDAPEPSTLRALAALHAAEPVRYLRSDEDWRLLMPGKGYIPAARGRGAALVLRGQVPAAYMLWHVRRARPAGGVAAEAEEAGAALVVDEFGGARPAVWRALEAARQRVGCAEVELRVYPWDQETLRALGRVGWTGQPERQQGTARVLDGTALLQGLVAPPPTDAAARAHWGPSAAALQALLPRAPLGTPEEAEQAAALTAAALGPGPHALPLPRSDGPNYI